MLESDLTNVEIHKLIIVAAHTMLGPYSYWVWAVFVYLDISKTVPLIRVRSYGGLYLDSLQVSIDNCEYSPLTDGHKDENT